MNLIKAAATLVFVLVSIQATAAVAQDLQYLADEELAAEIQARDADIDRTHQRIYDLMARHAEAKTTLSAAQMDLLETEKNLSQRAGLLYRLSHHGKAIRYLLYSASATGLLKRLETLRFLVITEMKARRAAGFRFTESQDATAILDTEITSAQLMLEQLEGTRDELLSEQRARLTAQPSLALR